MTVDSEPRSRLGMRIRSVVWQTPVINSYELVTADGGLLPAVEAGAHITVRLPAGSRSYSLLNPPGERHRYVIGVALDSASRGGSRHIHQTWRAGDLVEIHTPCNLFQLSEDAPHSVLIAGGIGVTPMLSMASRLQSLGASWELVHAVRSHGLAGFDELHAQWPDRARLHCDDAAGGVLDIPGLIAAAPPGSHFYCCGPEPMTVSFERACEHLPSERVHLERFAAPRLTSGPIESFEVVLFRSGQTIVVPTGTSILDALAEHGVHAPSSCAQGVCGVCETPVIEGIPEHLDALLNAAERASNKTMLICCSRSRTSRLVLDL